MLQPVSLLSLILLLSLCLLTSADWVCDPFFGNGLRPLNCHDALEAFREFAQGEISSPRRRLFTRDNSAGDSLNHLPRGFSRGDCAIGVDLSGMSGTAITSDWNTLYNRITDLVRQCVLSRGLSYGGYGKLDGFTFVVARPSTVSLSGTVLSTMTQHLSAVPDGADDLTITLLTRVQANAHYTANYCPPVFTNFPFSNFPPAVFAKDWNGIIVRQQGPWLLRRGIWTFHAAWFSNLDWASQNEWLLFRGVMPWFAFVPPGPPPLMLGDAYLYSRDGARVPLGGAWVSKGGVWRPIYGVLGTHMALSRGQNWLMFKGRPRLPRK